MANYYGIPTSIGIAAIANAAMLGVKISPTYFVVGDGNGTYYQPTADMTELRHEVWRGPVGICEIDPVDNNVMNFTAFIPSDVGGFTIREMGIIDDKGRLIGVANTPDVQKVQFEEGATTESELIISFVVTHPGVFEWKADPTVIIATKRDIAQHNSNGLSHPEILRQLTDRYSKAEVDAYLSNKANNSYRVVQESDLLVWAKKQKFTGAFDVSPAITTSGVPVVAWFSGYLEYSADNVFKLTVTDAYTGITYTNVTYAGAWSGWKKIATAEPPQRFSIPFASGWSNTTNSYFYKNQFGEVTIRAEATKNSTVDPLGTLFVLPEGYRPPQIIQFAVTFNFPFATVIVMVEPNGKVSTRSGVTEVVRGYFMNISFLTA